MGKSAGDSSFEEGEIIDNFEWISSSDEDLNFQQVDLHAERTLNNTHKRFIPDNNLNLNDARRVTTDFSSFSSEEFITTKKQKKRRRKKAKKMKVTHQLQEESRCGQKPNYETYRKRRRSISHQSNARQKFNLQNVDPYQLFSSDQDENVEDTSPYMNRNALRLALARSINVETTTHSLKKRLQTSESKENTSSQNNILSRFLNEVTNNDAESVSYCSDIPEEQELRLIALKSQMLKKHLARKKRNAEQAYSPTDFDVYKTNIDSFEDSLNLDEDKLSCVDNSMDISPCTSPKLPSPEQEMIRTGDCKNEDSSQFVSDQTVDMDIVNSESDELSNKTWPPIAHSHHLAMPEKENINENQFSDPYNYSSSSYNISAMQFLSVPLPPGIVHYEEVPPPPPPFKTSFSSSNNKYSVYNDLSESSRICFDNELTLNDPKINTDIELTNVTASSRQTIKDKSTNQNPSDFAHSHNNIGEESSDEERALRTLLLSKFPPNKKTKNKKLQKTQNFETAHCLPTSSNFSTQIVREKPYSEILKQAVIRLNSISRADKSTALEISDELNKNFNNHNALINNEQNNITDVSALNPHKRLKIDINNTQDIDKTNDPKTFEIAMEAPSNISIDKAQCKENSKKVKTKTYKETSELFSGISTVKLKTKLVETKNSNEIRITNDESNINIKSHKHDCISLEKTNLLNNVPKLKSISPSHSTTSLKKLAADANKNSNSSQKPINRQNDAQDRVITPKNNTVLINPAASRLKGALDTHAPQVKKLVINLRASETDTSDDEQMDLRTTTQIDQSQQVENLLKNNNNKNISSCGKSIKSITTLVETTQLDKNKSFERKLDMFLKNVRSNFQGTQLSKQISGPKNGKVNNTRTTNSLTASVVACHLPEASQKEYRQLVHRMKLLEDQKLNQRTGKNLSGHDKNKASPIEKKLCNDLARHGTLNVTKSAFITTNKSQQTPETQKLSSSIDASEVNLLHAYERAFQKTSSAIVMNINKSLQLVGTAEKIKFDKLRYEKRLKELQLELRKVQQKFAKEQQNMSKIYPEISNKISLITTLKKKRHKLSQVATNLGKKITGDDYRFNNEFRSEISSKSKLLATQIKHVNSIKYSNFEEIQKFANEQDIIQKSSTITVNQKDAVNHQNDVKSCSLHSNLNQPTVNILQEPTTERVELNLDACQSTAEETCHETKVEENEQLQSTENDKNNADACDRTDDNQHSLFAQSPNITENMVETKVLSDYNSPLSFKTNASRTHEIKLNPNGVICPYELMGQCEDKHCEYTHLSNVQDTNEVAAS